MNVNFIDGYYRAQHVTGPGCVLVSIAFGEPGPTGPAVVALPNQGGRAVLDIDAYVDGVLAGVARANSELGTSIQIKRIAYVPDDYPTGGQVEHAAYEITRHDLCGGF